MKKVARAQTNKAKMDTEGAGPSKRGKQDDGASSLKCVQKNAKRSNVALPKASESAQAGEKQGVGIGDKHEDDIIKDSKQLLAIFPEEIWEKLLDTIHNPTDLQNLNNASPYFRYLLFERRTLFLFPKVWEVLAPRYHKDRKLSKLGPIEENEVEDDLSVEESEPGEPCKSGCGRRRRLRWYSEILTFRLICRGWCEAVDALYEKHSEENSTDFRFQCNDFYISDYVEDEEQEEEEEPDNEFMHMRSHLHCLRHFKESHQGTKRNPFIGRRVIIKYITDQNEFSRKSILDLLKNYGYHLWHCELTVPENNSTVVQAYTQIRTFLELMPNLKTLYIHYFDKKSAKRPVAKKEVKQVAKAIALNPLQKLENLENIITDGSLPPSISNELFLRNNHVLSVELLGARFNDYLSRIPFPNLKSLELTLDKKDFENLEKSVVLESQKVEKLILTIKRDLLLEWPRVFKWFENKLGESLTLLRVNFPDEADSKAEQKALGKLGSYKFSLPKLRHHIFYI